MTSSGKQFVMGIGGVFFKCKDREALVDWYRKHFGIDDDGYGATFPFKGDEAKGRPGYSVWTPFEQDSDYFSPSDKDYMINFRIRDLSEFVELLRSEGVTIVGEVEEYDYGRFAWVLDPEGTKIELWEPLGETPEG